MKKIVLVTCIIVVIGIVILVNQIGVLMKDRNNKGPYNVNLQLYGSYEVNASGVRAYFGLLDDVPTIGFFQFLNSEELYAEHTKELGFELPDTFDFDLDNYPNKCLAITFGRKLEGIQYEYHKGDDVPFAEITFSEEQHEQTMYVYIMDNILFWPADLANYNSIYVINDGEKVYIGECLQNFNKLSPNFKEGI